MGLVLRMKIKPAFLSFPIISSYHGLAIEEKRDKYALNQSVANMIKLITDLTVIALKRGRVINKAQVYATT